MDDPLPKYLQKWQGRLKGLRLSSNKRIWKVAFLVLGMGLFFYSFYDTVAATRKDVLVAPTSVIELKAEKKIGNFVYVSKKTREAVAVKISVNKETLATALAATGTSLDEKIVNSLVAGHPIEKMVPFIAKRDKKVGSFLVAIAKKESDWGLYSPKKAGRECFNYWGFKGKYNPTESGYSCFDSPEQAIQQVGDRIQDLVSKQVNTPERMIVWKCGSTCAGHDPAGVTKWISDVRSYYTKLNS